MGYRAAWDTVPHGSAMRTVRCAMSCGVRQTGRAHSPVCRRAPKTLNRTSLAAHAPACAACGPVRAWPSAERLPRCAAPCGPHGMHRADVGRSAGIDLRTRARLAPARVSAVCTPSSPAPRCVGEPSPLQRAVCLCARPTDPRRSPACQAHRRMLPAHPLALQPSARRPLRLPRPRRTPTTRLGRSGWVAWTKACGPGRWALCSWM
jgi:hypothetical protein